MSYKEIQSTIHQLRINITKSIQEGTLLDNLHTTIDNLEKSMMMTASTVSSSTANHRRRSVRPEPENQAATAKTEEEEETPPPSSPTHYFSSFSPSTTLQPLLLRLVHTLNELTLSIARYDHRHNHFTLRVYNELTETLHRIDILYHNLTLYGIMERTYHRMEHLLTYLQHHVGTYPLLSTPLSLLQSTLAELRTSIERFHTIIMDYYSKNSTTIDSTTNVPTGEPTTSGSSSSLRTLPSFVTTLSTTALHETIRLTIRTIDSISSGILTILPVPIRTPLVRIKDELHHIIVDINDYFGIITMDTENNRTTTEDVPTGRAEDTKKNRQWSSSSSSSSSSSPNRMETLMNFTKTLSSTLLYWGIDFTLEQYVNLNHYIPIEDTVRTLDDRYRLQQRYRSFSAFIRPYGTRLQPAVDRLQHTLVTYDDYYLHGKGKMYTQQSMDITYDTLQYILHRYDRILHDRQTMSGTAKSTVPMTVSSSTSSSSSTGRSFRTAPKPMETGGEEGSVIHDLTINEEDEGITKDPFVAQREYPHHQDTGTGSAVKARQGSHRHRHTKQPRMETTGHK